MADPKKGYGIWDRLLALGFLILILAGNFWMMWFLFKNQPPKIVTNLFEIGLLLVVFGGLMKLVIVVKSWCMPPAETQEADLDSD